MNEATQVFSPSKRNGIKKSHFLCQEHDYLWECQVETSLFVTFSPFPGAAAAVSWQPDVGERSFF